MRMQCKSLIKSDVQLFNKSDVQLFNKKGNVQLFTYVIFFTKERECGENADVIFFTNKRENADSS